MTGLIISESELKKISRYTYNAKGFILIEFGARNQHHFRLDLDRWQNSRYQKMDDRGKDYVYSVNSIHLKRYLGANDDDTKDFWLYYYIYYTGHGIWKWDRDYVKREDVKSREFEHLTSTKEEQTSGYNEMTELLKDLSDAIGIEQKLAI